MKKQTLQISSIISVIGMICWIITKYFDGRIICLLQYWFVLIPIVILYINTLIRTIIEFSKAGLHTNKIILVTHFIFLIFVLTTNFIEPETFKSKIVFSGILRDDLFNYSLVFREDGTCEYIVNGFLTFEEKHIGKYKMNGNKISFIIKPYENNFLPDTLYLNKKENAIFLDKNSNTKIWLSYFELK